MLATHDSFKSILRRDLIGSGDGAGQRRDSGGAEEREAPLRTTFVLMHADMTLPLLLRALQTHTSWSILQMQGHQLLHVGSMPLDWLYGKLRLHLSSKSVLGQAI